MHDTDTSKMLKLSHRRNGVSPGFPEAFWERMGRAQLSIGICIPFPRSELNFDSLYPRNLYTSK
jgi:hypothetical protein